LGTPFSGSEELLETFAELLKSRRTPLEDEFSTIGVFESEDGIISSSHSELEEMFSANSFVSSEVPANDPESPQLAKNKIEQRLINFLNVFIAALLDVLGKRK
jgi:hypothetical protein